jgi:hypothetical protein
MEEARARDAWLHTSSVCSLIANCNRDPKKRPKPYEPSDFDPYGQKRKAKRDDRLVVPIDVLKLFCPGAIW